MVLRPKFPCRDSISVQVMLQHCLVLSAFLSRPRKSVATEACCPELDFLLQPYYDVATYSLGAVNVLCRDPFCYVVTELLCIQPIILSGLDLLCHDTTFLYYVEFFFAT